MRVYWTQGASPVKVEPRLRTLPASAAGTTARWSKASPKPQPRVTGGATLPDRLEVPRGVGCRLRRVASQSIGGFTTANVSWDTEDEDPYGFITVTGSTITIPSGYSGVYDCTVIVYPLSGTTTGSSTAVDVNGANRGWFWNDVQPNVASVGFAGRLFAAGDTIVWKQYNNAGGSINYQFDLYLYRRSA
jgi:hypothetical protein